MKRVLICAAVDEEHHLQKSALELLSRARNVGVKADLVPLGGIQEASLNDLKGALSGKIYRINNQGGERYSTRHLARLVQNALQASSADSAWFSCDTRSKEVCAYLGHLSNLELFEEVSDLSISGDSVQLVSDIYAGRFSRRVQLDSCERSAVCFTAGYAVSNSLDLSCEGVEDLISDTTNRIEFVGDLQLSQKEEGVALSDAEVILNVGDGVGAKGVAGIRKLSNLLKVKGVKVAVGGTRVVTDAGRLPRSAQIGVSGISVQPELIVSVGVSGAPQHWAGIQKAAYQVCVNTDADAPLMKLVDLPIQGDGHKFLKSLTESLHELLTEEQKEALKKTKPDRTSTTAGAINRVQEPQEDLIDLPLNIDLRGINFDAFEVYRAHEISESWNREKLTNLFRKVAKYTEKQMNQGRRNAERQGLQFLPGEEHQECAVITPEACKAAWHEYYSAGFGRISAPRSVGGLELPDGVQDFIKEIISAGSMAMGTYFGLTQGAQLIIQKFGNDWMKETLMPGLMDGRYQGTMCLTEAQAGSDLALVNTYAENIKGSDEFVLNGTKTFITCGDHDIAENIFHIVLAKIKGTGLRGTKAISLFLVPKFQVDEDGDRLEFNNVITQSIEHKSGIMTSPTCVLKFENARGWLLADNIEEEYRCPTGMDKMFIFMNAMRHETGTGGRGQAATTCLDALVYSMERVQGIAIEDMGTQVDQSAIFKHGNQKKNLCDMFARTQGGRGLTQLLTEIRDKAHKKYREDVAEHAQRRENLSLTSEQEKELERLCAQLIKIKRQTEKSRRARKRFRKEKETLKTLQGDLKTLSRQKEDIRARIRALSPEYLALLDMKTKAKTQRDDQELYASIFTSLVKAQVTDDCLRTLVEGMQALGGIGFMAETPVGQRLHDSQILCIWEGTNDIQSLNTVFRQIGGNVKDCEGRPVFERFMDELNQFMSANKDNPQLGKSIIILSEYARELSRFRNALTLATLRDKLKFQYLYFGFNPKPGRKEIDQAKRDWGMRMQAAARSFNTYFSQTVQAWQLLRGAVVSQKYLQELKENKETAMFDAQYFDENFLQGRILLAKHFVSSPNCMDRGIFSWRDLLWNSPAVEVEYGHLADAPSRISMT